MTGKYQTIAIASLAPAKPAFGAPCNGCGVCCLAQPCPIGMLLSWRRQGACVALQWDARLAAYRCGAITQPLPVLQRVLPGWMRGMAASLAPVLALLARRAIALDTGCDSTVELESDVRPSDA